MTELSQEHFDEAVRALPTKADVDEVKQVLAEHTETLNRHTDTLDAVARNTEHWKTEAAALKSRLDRHETWLQQLARKVGPKLGD